MIEMYTTTLPILPIWALGVSRNRITNRFTLNAIRTTVRTPFGARHGSPRRTNSETNQHKNQNATFRHVTQTPSRPACDSDAEKYVEGRRGDGGHKLTAGGRAALEEFLHLLRRVARRAGVRSADFMGTSPRNVERRQQPPNARKS